MWYPETVQEITCSKTSLSSKGYRL